MSPEESGKGRREHSLSGDVLLLGVKRVPWFSPGEMEVGGLQHPPVSPPVPCAMQEKESGRPAGPSEIMSLKREI